MNHLKPHALDVEQWLKAGLMDSISGDDVEYLNHWVQRFQGNLVS